MQIFELVRRQLLAHVEAVWHVRAEDVLSAVQNADAGTGTGTGSSGSQPEGKSEDEEKRDAGKSERDREKTESEGLARGRADATRLVRILLRLVNRLAAGSGHGLLEFIDPRFDRLQFIPECILLSSYHMATECPFTPLDLFTVVFVCCLLRKSYSD